MKDKNIIILNAIEKIDKDESDAKKFFKSAYHYDNFNNDYKQWRKHWFSLNKEEKKRIVGKGLKEKDFEKVLSALQVSKGNPFKAYKLLKSIKEDETKGH